MWTPGAVLVLVALCSAVTRDQFYPNGPGLDQRLPRGADVSSPEIPLKVPIVFFGETYESIFVNNYGVLSFRSDIPTFLNAEFPLPYPSIAAFYSNINTTETGAVYYRESNESYVLLKAEESIQNNFHDYYDFKPTSVFIASWIEVSSYSSIQRYDRKNTFQIAVISNGTESFVEILYPEREIQWIQRETPPGELPDAKAQAGFVAEDGRLFTLRGSGSHQIRNIVSWSNTQEPGKYVFRVGNIPREGLVVVPDQYDQYEVEVAEESKTCAQSGPSVCHLQARCVDYQAGICCQCKEGFYGNGKTCIKNDVPIRVHGKLNGVINDESFNDVDIQAYVVVADGRSYTAISQAPNGLGGSLQLLNVLGGVTGWLFAKPSGTAKNGYQLTGGVFNHTADIFFPESGDRITINQEYIGQDVFDQVAMDTDIRGTLPRISPGSRLDITEYEEQYTIVEPGQIHSASDRTFSDRTTGQKYVQRISQTFSYNPCKFAPSSEESHLTLKVYKNYLGYEPRENIVRYGTSNKIQEIGREDPCIKGRLECAPHSKCIAQGDSFTCVCETGFTSLYYAEITVCVDVDECEAGTHNCDTNADCNNRDGSFECRCRPGYEGNGISCNRVSQCRNKACDPNAQCIDNNSAAEAICICNPGYTGDGISCYDTTCSNCSPYAYCGFPEGNTKLQCRCNPGYVGDGYNCVYAYSSTEPYIDTTTVDDVTEPFEISTLQSTTPALSDTEYNEHYVLPNCDNFGCECPSGYSSFKHRGNDLCRIDIYGGDNNEEKKDNSITCNSDADCPPNAICSFAPESYLSNDQEHGQCVCPEGYEGDAYECIERSGTSCSCGPSAHCIDTAAGELICVCDLGYHGDGYVCRPNFSCTNNSDCEYYAECQPDPNTGENVCQCIDGYIKDQSDACIPDQQLCNGAVCAQHASCLYDDTIQMSYCHCDKGYEGDAILKCVPIAQTCEVTHECGINAICTPSEGSYSCVCLEGFFGDGYTCTQDCRTNINLCDVHAYCVKTTDAYECECKNGYTGNGNNCDLIPREAGNFLVASEGASVYRVPFSVTLRDFATPLNSAVYQIAVGLDVDCLAGNIYWGDVGASSIKRTSYDGSRFEEFLSNGVQSPEGIAVDWEARNIFWTDSKKLTIEVINIDTKLRKVLFEKDGISNPRGIAVHPGIGKVFWSDWYRSGPKIEWANMDGSQRGVFLDQSDVKLPNSLAIDWKRDRLCYSDAGLLIIKCVSIQTMEREIIAENCSYPFGLAINGDTFYWTDWKTRKIEFVNHLTQVKGQVPVAIASRRLYGVAVAPDRCPDQRNVCGIRNGNCGSDQICLPNGQGGRTCVSGN
ncbi:jg20911 [Pararge aegeria aegeria]|uniref:Jg20911 protein n=1 Tax=Pararge aegeria aegeria TaxID=348720 RepID=A0A8S4RKX1_9NEOP|nr:jg20911 [Pararge aegeria aegeria]